MSPILWNRFSPSSSSNRAVQPFRDFLYKRKALLNGESHPAFVPFRHADGRFDCWPEAIVRKLKNRLEQASGVSFKIETFRATFGQRASDAGAKTESVRVTVRHGPHERLRSLRSGEAE